jgi:uncharacterized protein (DUF1800 family)
MNKLNLADARHLVVRTGLGADWSVLRHLRGQEKSQAIQSLHKHHADLPPAPPKMTHWKRLNDLNKSSYVGQKQARAIARQEGINLKLWWIKHLLQTKTPLVERMTLFWHNHFTSSITKVLQPQLLHQQNLMLRQYSLGNFAEMLHAVLRDPAMLIYLDGHLNQKNKLNENFAREFLELFTLGQGHYSENDIKTVAHAFTGWQVNRFNATSFYREANHSQASLSFLGQKGIFSADDIVDIILKQPRTAEFIAEKFWYEFISIRRPQANVIKQWAQQFRERNYDIKVLLNAVLNSPEFWHVNNRGQRIKSPIEFIVGTYRSFNYAALSDKEIINTLQRLGQSLFDPPNVAGWKGGNAWINTDSLLTRNAFLERLKHPRHHKHITAAIPDVSNSILQSWLLAIAPVLPSTSHLDPPQLIHSLLLDPSYQLT